MFFRIAAIYLNLGILCKPRRHSIDLLFSDARVLQKLILGNPIENLESVSMAVLEALFGTLVFSSPVCRIVAAAE